MQETQRAMRRCAGGRVGLGDRMVAADDYRRRTRLDRLAHGPLDRFV
jgi:hypothetical protein